MFPLKVKTLTNSTLLCGLLGTLGVSVAAYASIGGAEMKKVTISSCGRSGCFKVEAAKAEQGLLGSSILKPVRITLYSAGAAGATSRPLEVIEGSEGYFDMTLQTVTVKNPKRESGVPTGDQEVMLDFADGTLLKF